MERLRPKPSRAPPFPSRTPDGLYPPRVPLQATVLASSSIGAHSRLGAGSFPSGHPYGLRGPGCSRPDHGTPPLPGRAPPYLSAAGARPSLRAPAAGVISDRTPAGADVPHCRCRHSEGSAVGRLSPGQTEPRALRPRCRPLGDLRRRSRTEAHGRTSMAGFEGAGGCAGVRVPCCGRSCGAMALRVAPAAAPFPRQPRRTPEVLGSLGARRRERRAARKVVQMDGAPMQFALLKE